MNIEDLAKLGRAISMVMAGLCVSLRPVLPDTLVEEVGRHPGVIRELDLSTVGGWCTGCSPCSSGINRGWTAWR
jgi:hypothetical protein